MPILKFKLKTVKYHLTYVSPIAPRNWQNLYLINHQSINHEFLEWPLLWIPYLKHC